MNDKKTNIIVMIVDNMPADALTLALLPEIPNTDNQIWVLLPKVLHILGMYAPMCAIKKGKSNV
jgi:hypothetical protein